MHTCFRMAKVRGRETATDRLPDRSRGRARGGLERLDLVTEPSPGSRRGPGPWSRCGTSTTCPSPRWHFVLDLAGGHGQESDRACPRRPPGGARRTRISSHIERSPPMTVEQLVRDQLSRAEAQRSWQWHPTSRAAVWRWPPPAPPQRRASARRSPPRPSLGLGGRRCYVLAARRRRSQTHRARRTRSRDASRPCSRGRARPVDYVAGHRRRRTMAAVSPSTVSLPAPETLPQRREPPVR